MPRNAMESIDLAQALTPRSRLLLAEIAELLSTTGERYVTHLQRGLQLCREAASIGTLAPAPILGGGG